MSKWILLSIGLSLLAVILLLLLWRFKGQGQLSVKHIKLKKYKIYSSTIMEHARINKTVINGSQRTTTSEPLEAKISRQNSSNPFTGKIVNKRSTAYITLMESKGDRYGSVSSLQ